MDFKYSPFITLNRAFTANAWYRWGYKKNFNTHLRFARIDVTKLHKWDTRRSSVSASRRTLRGKDLTSESQNLYKAFKDEQIEDALRSTEN